MTPGDRVRDPKLNRFERRSKWK